MLSVDGKSIKYIFKIGILAELRILLDKIIDICKKSLLCKAVIIYTGIGRDEHDGGNLACKYIVVELCISCRPVIHGGIL